MKNRDELASFEDAYLVESFIYNPSESLLEQCTKAVFPNHRSVGRLVPGCRERINTLFNFRYIDDHTRKFALI